MAATLSGAALILSVCRTGRRSEPGALGLGRRALV